MSLAESAGSVHAGERDKQGGPQRPRVGGHPRAMTTIKENRTPMSSLRYNPPTGRANDKEKHKVTMSQK